MSETSVAPAVLENVFFRGRPQRGQLQKGIPAYKFALQHGDAGYIANANIQLWIPSDAGYNPSNLYRHSLARYFLLSVDEWYKAAYYDPTSGVFYDYPTGSDSAPTPVAIGTAAGTASLLGKSGGVVATTALSLAAGLPSP